MSGVKPRRRRTEQDCVVVATCFQEGFVDLYGFTAVTEQEFCAAQIV